MARHQDDKAQQPQLFKRLLDLPLFQEEHQREALNPSEEQEVDSAAYRGWRELPEKLPALQDSIRHYTKYLLSDTGARRSSGAEAQNRAESYSREYQQRRNPQWGGFESEEDTGKARNSYKRRR